jgi:uncharacterized protein (DUF58 family)
MKSRLKAKQLMPVDRWPEPTSRLVERHFNAPLLLILCAIFAALYLVTNYRGWLVFALGTGSAWLLAWAWIKSLEKNLWLERKIHIAWATVGKSVPEQVKLVNRGWFPALWVEISDDSTTLERPLRLVSDVDSHTSRNRHITHLFKRRGLYALGPTRIRSGDPLGIYTLTLHDQHASSILVTPPLLPLANLHLLPGGWAGDERQVQGSVARNISTSGLREYVPGDSLRRIHWRASAHLDQLIVRQLEASSSRDWWIIVDLDRSVQAGKGDYSTLELCVILAASLAMRGLQERRRVGLLLAGPNLVRIEPRADPLHRWQLMRPLAMAEDGKVALPELLTMIHPQASAALIVISPATNPAWVPAAARQHRGSGMMALLVNPQEFGHREGLDAVENALSLRQIKFQRMPRQLLEEAYTSVNQQGNLNLVIRQPAKRYLHQGRQAWQDMG